MDSESGNGHPGKPGPGVNRYLGNRYHRQATPGHSVGGTVGCWLCDEFREAIEKFRHAK